MHWKQTQSPISNRTPCVLCGKAIKKGRKQLCEDCVGQVRFALQTVTDLLKVKPLKKAKETLERLLKQLKKRS